MGTLAAFTVFVSAALGVVSGPNVIYGVAVAFTSIMLVAIPSCVLTKEKMIEVFPVAVAVACVTFVGGVVAWRVILPDAHPAWAIVTLLLNCLGVIWLGFEMDWICARLNPDEWLLPVCLVWAEILTVILMSIFAAAGGDMEFYEGCGTGAVLYMHCDCWVYDNGDSSKRLYYQNLQKFEKSAEEVDEEGGEKAPQQEVMGDSQA